MLCAMQALLCNLAASMRLAMSCGGKYTLYHLLIYLRGTVNVGTVVTAISFLIHRNIVFLYFTWGSKVGFDFIFLTGFILYFTAPGFSFIIFHFIHNVHFIYILTVLPLPFTPEKECKTYIDIISILGFAL